MSPHRDSSVKFGWSLRAIAHFCLCQHKPSLGNSSRRSRSSRRDSGQPASASTRRLRRLNSNKRLWPPAAALVLNSGIEDTGGGLWRDDASFCKRAISPAP